MLGVHSGCRKWVTWLRPRTLGPGAQEPRPGAGAPRASGQAVKGMRRAREGHAASWPAAGFLREGAPGPWAACCSRHSCSQLPWWGQSCPHHSQGRGGLWACHVVQTVEVLWGQTVQSQKVLEGLVGQGLGSARHARHVQPPVISECVLESLVCQLGVLRSCTFFCYCLVGFFWIYLFERQS